MNAGHGQEMPGQGWATPAGRPFPAPASTPVLDLVAYHDPGLDGLIRVWYYAAPAVAVVLAGSLGLSVWRVWFHPGLGSAPPVRHSKIWNTPGGPAAF